MGMHLAPTKVGGGTAPPVGRPAVPPCATLCAVETRPTPEEMRPELTLAAQAWRYALCLVVSAIVWTPIAGVEWREHRLFFWTEVLLGVAAYVVVWFRRRAPVTVALVVAAMSTLSGIAAGPATLAAVSVATSRRVGPILVVGVANFAAAQGYTDLAPWETGNSIWISVGLNAVVNAGIMGWGMYIGSRRELLWTLRHRAEHAVQHGQRHAL